jgi:hypothetical protein
MRAGACISTGRLADRAGRQAIRARLQLFPAKAHLHWRSLLRKYQHDCDGVMPPWLAFATLHDTNIDTNRIISICIDIERKNRLLKVCYVPATSTTFLAFFLAVAINSTIEANKAGGKRS